MKLATFLLAAAAAALLASCGLDREAGWAPEPEPSAPVRSASWIASPATWDR